MPANKRATIAFLALAFFVLSPLASSSSSKRAKSDRDIEAIGHREIVPEQIRKFLGSSEKDKERGDAVAARIQHSTKVIQDPAVVGYVAELAENLAHNSDARMPITVTLIDSDEVNACTSPGGYQYVTRGLLLQLESESELAAVLAHGIAHSALHTPTVQFLRGDLMRTLGATPAPNLWFTWLTCTSPTVSIPSGMRQTDEFDADYFGAQYLYKTGYDTDGYIRFVQRVWATPDPRTKQKVLAFGNFPPTAQRSKALRHEIAEILPLRKEATVSTSAFDNFEDQLRTWQKQHPEVPPPTQPILRRIDGGK